MKMNLIFKLCIISLFIINGLPSVCSSYVSLSPVFTEIIYALDAEENLLAVSNTCNYPKDAKSKPVIGDTFSVNKELLLTLNPDYLFAMQSSKTLLSDISYMKTNTYYFEFENIEDIYSAVNKIGKLISKEKEAEVLTKKIQNEIKNSRTSNPQKILYIIQINPIITIGAKSFITDVINKSGHYSVTSDLNYNYPSVSAEYLIKTKPDIVITNSSSYIKPIQKYFPYTKIIAISPDVQDIINRPGPRIYEAVKTFSNLSF